MSDAKASGHIPPGFSAVTPYLLTNETDRLVAFLKAAFRAEDADEAYSDKDGIVHAALRVEGCSVEIGRASGAWKALHAGIHLYVPDVDAAYARALAAGGKSLHEVRVMDYGERAAAVEDPSGNHWYIATYTG